MIHLKVEFQDGQRLGLKGISTETESPEPFTAKILQQLVRHGLVESMRGPNGGFAIRDPKSELNLLQVVRAIDGDGIICKCVLGLEECSNENPCAAHDQFVEVRNHLAHALSSTTVNQVAVGVRNNQRLLKRRPVAH
ncbi:MAG: Rrf2 family transcriptional regulator [Flavobacteriales bacterium]|nr:Rrf2 family transcriptional regulator [Flavobacteriales bacterium]